MESMGFLLVLKRRVYLSLCVVSSLLGSRGLGLALCLANLIIQRSYNLGPNFKVYTLGRFRGNRKSNMWTTFNKGSRQVFYHMFYFYKCLKLIVV